MKSLRLNKELRTTILNSFLDKYKSSNPEPEVGDVSKAQQKAAINAQKAVYGKYEGLLPDEFVVKSNNIQVRLPNGSIQHWYFGYDEEGDSIYLLMSKESKVKYVFTDNDSIYAEYRKVADTVKQQQTVYDEWEKGYQKFKSEVTQVLESVNTTGQLVEVWPESLPFIPQEISDPSKINLPSVNFAEINKVIS
jgi:hypothetical protein